MKCVYYPRTDGSRDGAAHGHCLTHDHPLPCPYDADPIAAINSRIAGIEAALIAMASGQPYRLYRDTQDKLVVEYE